MIKIIFIAIVVLIIFFTRNLWGMAIVNIIKRKKKVVVNSNTQQNALVFSPAGTVRTFNLAIELTEKGDGTVEIGLAKIKAKDI